MAKAPAKPKASTKAKGDEVQDETTQQNAVVPVNENANLPAGMSADFLNEIEENEGQRQVFDADQLTIPRLALLQDLSPETKVREETYIEGAIPGMILNKLKKAICDEVIFVPSKFVVRYIAWRPRKDGGGLVDQNLTLEEVRENFDTDGPGRWVGMLSPREGEDAVKVEVIQTPEWVGFAKSDTFDWTPVAISFPSTKSKVVRDINSIIDLAKIEVNGRRITPAAFFHQFTLGSFLDSSGDDKYYNFTAKHDGYCMDPQVRADAKKLKESFDAGEVAVEDAATKS